MGKLSHIKILKEMTTFYEPMFNWNLLCESLLRPNQHCAVMNKYCKSAEDLIQKIGLENKDMVFTNQPNVKDALKTQSNKHTDYLKVFRSKKLTPSLHSVVSDKGDIFPYYLMDLASLLPVLLLDIRPSDCVLDMCASPGGKTIALLQLLSPWTGQLVSNDFSKKRFNRLQKVINEYVPEVLQRNGHIVATNINAEKFGTEERCTFDKVLVDVPCSSERHVVQNDFQFRGWSVSKMKENAKLQSKLLLAALHSVKPGGIVSYSTCSISPWENDLVVEKTIDDAIAVGLNISLANNDEHVHSTVLKFDDNTFNVMDTTLYGVLVIPSELSNWGPMYFAKIKKN